LRTVSSCLWTVGESGDEQERTNRMVGIGEGNSPLKRI
jgi:hypothetical protein